MSGVLFVLLDLGESIAKFLVQLDEGALVSVLGLLVVLLVVLAGALGMGAQA